MLELLARRVVAEHVLPVDLAEYGFDLLGAVAGRVHAADDRAHARAGDLADRNVLALEHLEHADVRRAARAAAAEDESDAIGRARVQGRKGNKRCK